MSEGKKKPKWNMRVIGNPGGNVPQAGGRPRVRSGSVEGNCGMDPGIGIGGNDKSRRFYPVSQEAQYCPRESECARKRSSKACKYECNLYSMFKPKAGNRKEKRV